MASQEFSDDAGQNGPATVSTRVYVGNLAWEVRWQDLKDHMKQAGPVVRADVFTEGRGGRSKGCGVVEFASVEGALCAIETLNDSELQGRLIFVREDREPEARGGGGGGGRAAAAAPAGGYDGGYAGAAAAEELDQNQLYVGNLSWATTWQDLKDLFSSAGNVEFADIMQSGGRSKGFGIVRFATPEGAQCAIDTLNGSEFDGRTIVVRIDNPNPATRGGSRAPRTGGSYGGAAAGGGYGAAAGGNPGTQLYVGNLSWATTWQDLKELFMTAGTVEYADIMQSGGRSKGFGIVRFATPEGAQCAIDTLNDSEFDGRMIVVRPDSKA